MTVRSVLDEIHGIVTSSRYPDSVKLWLIDEQIALRKLSLVQAPARIAPRDPGLCPACSKPFDLGETADK